MINTNGMSVNDMAIKRKELKKHALALEPGCDEYNECIENINTLKERINEKLRNTI